MPTADQMRERIDAYRAAAAKSDVDAYLENFTETATAIDPVGQPPHEGPEALRRFAENGLGLVDGIEFVPEDVIVCGDNEAVMYSTFKAHMKNGAGTMLIRGIHNFVFADDGRFELMKVWWDPATAKVEGA